MLSDLSFTPEKDLVTLIKFSVLVDIVKILVFI